MISEALEFITGFSDMIFKPDKKKKLESKEYQPEEVEPHKFSFRPRNLDEYIGQENAKDKVRLNIQKIMTVKPVHMIISGTKGHGKTSLTYVIANELGFEISTYIGSEFTQENLGKFLLKNENAVKPQILFIDEIHDLGKDKKKLNPTFLYPILEDFLLPIGSAKLRPFILIGATTDKEKLEVSFSPLLDRCVCIDLEHYTAEDIKQIVKQYNHQIYKELVPENIYDTISMNTRYNPRISLAMFDDYMVCKDINRVLRSNQIVKNSLTKSDVKILEHLVEINKPVGAETLSIIIQRTVKNYATLVEPFLIQQGYISRTSRGRVATEKTKQLLQEIK